MTNVPLTPRKTLETRPGRGLAAAAGLLLLLAAPPALAGGSLSPDLVALQLVAEPEGEVNVIISYSRRPDATHRGRAKARGASGVRDLALVDGVAARVPVGRLRQLAEDRDVLRVSWDETVRASTDVAVPAAGGYLARQALALDGSGIRVAILDSGIEPATDLADRIVAWVDLVEPHRTAPSDPYGHGTHVAGIVAAAEREIHEPGHRAVYGGMAPGAELVSVRVLDRFGEGRSSDVIAGIEWVVLHMDDLGIRILNLSLGHPVRDPSDEDPLVLACERAWEAGLLVVVSAGNLGRSDVPYGTVTSPGNAASVLTVGALADLDTVERSDDLIATYSSRGPTRFDATVKPDLLAPGDGIVSLRSPHSKLDRLFPANRVGSDGKGAASPELFVLSGTSMAAAVTSGAAALLLSADPQLDPDTLKARLMRSAEKRAEDLYARGAGALDVMAALDDDGFAGLARSPRVNRGDFSIELSGPELWSDEWSWEEVYGPAALWDESLVWDVASLWGDGSEQVDQVMWQVPVPGEGRASSVIWQIGGPVGGDSVIWQIEGPIGADSVIWQIDGPVGGESVIWQTESTVSGDSVIWQSGRNGGGRPSQNDISAESVIWQVDGDAMDILVHGDGGGAR